MISSEEKSPLIPPSDQKSDIDFYFDFISPYGWLAAEQIGNLARRFQRNINWRPFLLKVTVLDTMKLPPPIETPLKGEYLIHDIKRSLRYHGMELTKHPKFGFNSLAPARFVLWTKQHAPNILEDLILALYREHWSKGNDISHKEIVLKVASNLGLKPDIAASAFDDPKIKKALQDYTTAAIKVGVFGSPSFIIDGEIFWGADRIPMIETWLGSGSW